MNIKDFPSLQAFEVSIDENHVAEICLKRAQALNTMNQAFWDELPQVVAALDNEGAARVIILSASGKHFTAGMDLAILKGLDRDKHREPARCAEHMRRWVLALQNCFTQLETARMPIISAIQGACIGGGVDMICATDMRYCTRDAFFNIKETALGITADLGTLQRIQHVMPSGLARELAYTSRNMTAQEALSCGFVNQLFDHQSDMLNHVRAIATDIARHSPMAVHGSKQMLNYSRDHALQDSLNYMATWQAGMLQTPDIYQAIQASAEKRQPIFDNLPPNHA